MTGKSQSLEVISRSGGDPPSNAERRRRPRLQITNEQFRLAQNGKVFPVADLSAEGMAFRILDKDDLLILPVAMRIEGTLNLRGERHVVKAKVKHVGGSIVGCQFEGLSDTARRALEKFLDPEVMGRELRPIPSSGLASLWYHGPSGTDLLFSRVVGKEFHRLTIYILGCFVQWDFDEGLSTGRAEASTKPSSPVDAPLEAWGIIQFETMLMTPDLSPDPEKLAIAKALILSSNLPQDLKNWCIRQIS